MSTADLPFLIAIMVCNYARSPWAAAMLVGLLGPQHFGLDQAKGVSFRIIWPDGAHSEWAKSKPNQRLQVIRSGDALAIFPY